MNPSAPRRIMITGATRGLGRALAESFARSGQQVFGCGRSADAVEELRSLFGSPHAFDVVDVADDPGVKRWASGILDAFGPPDLLINNAALTNRPAPLWEVPHEEFAQMVSVNILGVANVIRHVVPSMVAKGSGVIVNLSSGWGRSTSPHVAPYCATKFAIEGLTRALAQELPTGMAAVPLNPGVIDTDMLRTSLGSRASGFPSPHEWAKSAAPFLLGLTGRDNGKSLSVP